MFYPTYFSTNTIGYSLKFTKCLFFGKFLVTTHNTNPRLQVCKELTSAVTLRVAALLQSV
jgi:hypothetical protein